MDRSLRFAFLAAPPTGSTFFKPRKTLDIDLREYNDYVRQLYRYARSEATHHSTSEGVDHQCWSRWLVLFCCEIDFSAPY